MNFEETFVFKLDVQKQLLDMGLKPSTTGLYKAVRITWAHLLEQPQHLGRLASYMPRGSV